MNKYEVRWAFSIQVDTNRKVKNVLSLLVWVLRLALNDAIGYNPVTKVRLAATNSTEVQRTPY